MEGGYPDNTIPSIDERFCGSLERTITEFFRGSADNDIRELWCDGVSVSSHEARGNFRDHLISTREFETTAWIGREVQDEYRLVLRFGNRSIKLISEDGNIVCCIPSTGLTERFEIDLSARVMWIDLD